MQSKTSSPTSAKPTVLVVGSGPAGLTLALSLLRNGVPVRVIEKNAVARIGQRGAGIVPRTFEVFERLGIVDEIAHRAKPLPIICVYKMPEAVDVIREIEMAPILPPRPDAHYLNSCFYGQDKLDKIMRSEMAKYGCSVEYGVGLAGLEQDDSGVHVRLLNQVDLVEEASYDYVIGADGARSTVRKQLGLPFLGETREENFVVGDLKIEGLRSDRWHVFGEMAQVIIWFRPTEDEGVYNMFLGGSKLENHKEIIANEANLKGFMMDLTGHRKDIMFGEILYIDHYRTNIRMTTTFRQGRVFITGDAGHVHSPSGGQGMNTSVQDSFNLGWKLGLVASGLAPPSLLDTYSEERIPVVAEMLDLTTLVMKMTMAESTAPAGWDRSSDNIKQLGVNYRSSSIVKDEEAEKWTEDERRSRALTSSVIKTGGFQGGDRAPDAPGLVIHSSNKEVTRLHLLFSPSRHTVLIFSDASLIADCEIASTIVNTFSRDLVHVAVITAAGQASPQAKDAQLHKFDIVEDRDGHAFRAYRGAGITSTIFTIRPDGVLGARVGNIEGLRMYFHSIFDGNTVG